MYYSDNDFRLYHHGILGQKWGRKNGPPYPLDSAVSTGKRLKAAVAKGVRTAAGKIKEHNAKQAEVRAAKKEAKKAEEEEKARQQKEAAKQKVIASGDYNQVNAIKDQLTTDELREAATRVQLTYQLNNNAPRPETTNKIKDATNKLSDTVNFARKGMEAWNTFATVYNAVSKDDQVPILEAGWAKKQAEDRKRAADEARKEAEKAFVRNATPQDIQNYASRLSTEALKDASTRATYLNTLSKYMSGDSTTKQESKAEKVEEPAQSTKNTWTRDENNPYWSAAYRKVANTKMTEETVKSGADYIKEVMASEEYRKLSARLP